MKTHRYQSYFHYLDTQYATNTQRRFITRLKRHLRLQDIGHAAEIYEGRRCLCVGCRDDSEVRDFQERGYQALGIDILETQHQVQGDLNKLEEHFAPKSFDFAYLCHSLEHSFDPAKLISDLHSICVEGVYLVLPVRSGPDEEEPVWLEVMSTREPTDLLNWMPVQAVLKGCWERVEGMLPSGPEVAIALAWDKHWEG